MVKVRLNGMTGIALLLCQRMTLRLNYGIFNVLVWDEATLHKSVSILDLTMPFRVATFVSILGRTEILAQMNIVSV